jgi:hypothetical protein
MASELFRKFALILAIVQNAVRAVPVKEYSMNWIGKRFACLGPLLFLAACAVTGTARADLLTNGGFETGTFAGWTVANQTGGSAGWFIQTGTSSPVNFFPAPAPPQGTHAAMTDDPGTGSHALLQPFTVAPGSKVTLSFDIYVNNFFGGFFSPASLDFNTIPNQQARIDILTAGATPFALGGSVLDNVFDATANTAGYVAETFDITSTVGGGGTFQLRFVEVDNLGFFNLGVDAASIVATPASVPEPTGLILLATVVIGLASRRSGTRRPLRAHPGGVGDRDGLITSAKR